MLSEKINAEKWGAKVLEQIAGDLQKQLPGLRGISRRNLLNMKRLFTEYQSVIIMQSATAQLREVRNKKNKGMEINAEFRAQFLGISFTHHILLLDKCQSTDERIFYITQAADLFWSVSVLEHHINADLYKHQGKLPNNFNKTLPEQLMPPALQVFQDEYLMDFLSPSDNEDERVFENKVVTDIRNFIMRMGKGFSFIGNQYRLEVGGEEFFVDLLFFNRHLQCLVAFELKRGKFNSP